MALRRHHDDDDVWRGQGRGRDIRPARSRHPDPAAGSARHLRTGGSAAYEQGAERDFRHFMILHRKECSDRKQWLTETFFTTQK